MRMDGQTDLPGLQAGKPGENRMVGRLGQRIDRDSEEEMAHGGITGEDGLVDRPWRDPVPHEQPAAHLVEGLKDQLPELGRFFRFRKRIGQPGDDVGTAPGLAVEGGFQVERFPGLEVNELHDQGRRSDVDGKAEVMAERISRLHRYDLLFLVDGHRHFLPGPPQHGPQLHQGLQRNLQGLRSQAQEYPFEQGIRRRDVRLGELKVILLDCRVGDDDGARYRGKDGDVFVSRGNGDVYNEVGFSHKTMPHLPLSKSHPP